MELNLDAGNIPLSILYDSPTFDFEKRNDHLLDQTSGPMDNGNCKYQERRSSWELEDSSSNYSDESHVFSEVSFKFETYYRCEDCGQKYLTKVKFNDHVPNCCNYEEDFFMPEWIERDSPVVLKRSPKVSATSKQSTQQRKKQRFHVNKRKVSTTAATTPTIDSNVNNLKCQPPSSDKFYKCDVCQKLYNTYYGFQLHVRSHTGDKRHCCDICQKRFSQSGHLKDHMRIHTGEKPYSCSMCDKKFAQNQNRLHHMRMFHKSDAKIYNCKQCDKFFYTEVELLEHDRVHTTGYPCDRCDRHFTSATGLRMHRLACLTKQTPLAGNSTEADSSSTSEQK